MPAISAPAKVLVTGASGFLAAYVVRTLLEDGYTVVGTGTMPQTTLLPAQSYVARTLPVRSPAKGKYLADYFKSPKFSYVIVEDIEKSDAFDEVVKSGNFEAIEHIASPFHVRPSMINASNLY